MKSYNQKSLIFIVLILALAGCTSAPIPSVAPATKPAIEPTITVTSESLESHASETTDQANSLPVAAEYNLGETTIIQSVFPEDSRFRNMPVHLNGIIAVPNGDGAPYP